MCATHAANISSVFSKKNWHTYAYDEPCRLRSRGYYLCRSMLFLVEMFGFAIVLRETQTHTRKTHFELVSFTKSTRCD